MIRSIRFWSLLAASNAIGLLLAWIDSRPTWDDSGISVALVLGASAFFGFASPKGPWIWAASVGIWVPVIGILGSQEYPSIVALMISIGGAYGGAALRGRLIPQ